MPKYLGRRARVGYCQRTGFKLDRRDLAEDGELPGVLVEASWADPLHPQRFLPEVGMEMPITRPAPPQGDPRASTGSYSLVFTAEPTKVASLLPIGER